MIFWWRRDQREARQEARDAQRLKRESRQELHALFDRDVGAWEKLFDAEQDEAKKERIRQEFTNRLMAQVVLLDEAIVRHPEFRMLPSSATVLLGKGSVSVSVPARLRSLADEITKKGHPEQALQVLSLVEELDPEPSPWTRIYKAHAFDRMGKIDDALAELDHATSQASTHRRALADKCALLVHARRTVDAMAAAEQLLAEEDDVIASYLVSVVADSQGQRKRAVDVIDRAIGRWPDDPSLLNVRLRLKVESGAPDVMQAAEKAVEANPADDEVYLILARWHLKEGNSRSAVEYAAKAVEIDANSVTSRLLLAEALAASGDYDKALGEVGDAGHLEPTNPWVPFMRAKVLVERMNTVEAWQEGERHLLSACSAVIEHPNASQLLRIRALILRGFAHMARHDWDMMQADLLDAEHHGMPEDMRELVMRVLKDTAAAISSCPGKNPPSTSGALSSPSRAPSSCDSARVEPH